jgi:hypothetical protein
MMPSPFEFKRYGQCGMEMTELMPHLGSVADEVAFIRSMHGEHFNHEPSIYLMQSGRTLSRKALARRVGDVRARIGESESARIRGTR